jgi:hypothetical protein
VFREAVRTQLNKSGSLGKLSLTERRVQKVPGSCRKAYYLMSIHQHCRSIPCRVGAGAYVLCC